MSTYTAGLVTALAAALGLGVALPPVAAGTDARPVVAAPAPLRVMPLGDSITWGTRQSGNSYRDFLWNRLAAEGHALDFVGSGRNGPMADPDNEGHSGWRIDQIAGIADSALARHRPNVITLEIGTNDLDRLYEIPTAPDRLSALIDRLTTDAPDATVLVGTLIISTSGNEEPLRPAFNAAVAGIVQAEQAAGRHVRLIDMGALTTADLADALHPKDSGFSKMADAFNAGVQAADSDGWLHEPVTAPVGPVRSGIADKCLDVSAGSSAHGATSRGAWSRCPTARPTTAATPTTSSTSTPPRARRTRSAPYPTSATPTARAA